MSQKKSVNLLPEYLKTDKNTKFLSSVVDPLIQTPEIQRIDGYIGSKLSLNFNPSKDFYLQSDSYLKNSYTLEPALVIKNNKSEITDVIAFDDLINEISTQGGFNNNLDRLFKTKFYSYDPPISWDKFINYSEYHWLPVGPDAILIDNSDVDIFSTLIGQTTYDLPYIDSDTGSNFKLSNGMKLVFSTTVTSNDGNITIFAEEDYIVEGVGSAIELIRFKFLEPNEKYLQIYDEKFDSDSFDEYPFDGDSKLPVISEYITINKSSKDLNPWTRYNRWFHKNIIEISSKINNKPLILSSTDKAKRPIIEFNPNLQLFNFGKKGIENVDLIDTTSENIFDLINQSVGAHIDTVLLEEGFRIIFNNEKNLNYLGKIYKVTFDYTETSPKVVLVEDLIPSDLDSISVNFGANNGGKNYYYSSTENKWVEAQQKTKLNQAPLFDLFNNDGISYTKIPEKNNFTGNKIFGYEVGNGQIDPVLGFSVKTTNSSGIGSFKFKNYFMSDNITITDNSISNVISTGITYIKDNTNFEEKFINVWNNSIQDVPLSIVEIQTLSDNTSTLYINSIDDIENSTLHVDVLTKNSKIGTYIITGTNAINLESALSINDVVQLKITTDKNPNKNGYYEIPVSLSNNPLNGSISEFSFTELSDHLGTMINKLDNFVGEFPGNSNLRDLSAFSKLGSKLVINSNPIAFAQFFLGKKEYNLIDSIRHASNQYNQFKMALINATLKIDGQLLPRTALDNILISFNKNKNSNFSYYNSDMLGYGPNKNVVSYTIFDSLITEYSIGNTFDITKLNYKALLVYLNNSLLVLNEDYIISQSNDYIEIKKNLVIGDVVEIVFYPNTLGCYIPATPTKLGMYPKFKPQIIKDFTYSNNPEWMILGHDGSLTKAYGNYDNDNLIVDYRDEIILEFEKRVFNNIKVNYNKNIFDVHSIIPGNSRPTKYSTEEVNSILEKDYISWAGTYNVDFRKNNSFVEGNFKTWNYKNSVDINSNIISGTWRNVFNYFYDTDRPDTHPWEILGIKEKPIWWDNYYSWTDTAKRTALITAIVGGLIDEPPSTKVDLNYAKPNFESIIPVDESGNLKEPHTFLVTNNSYLDKKEKWIFGDYSPSEVTWRRSSYYPFAINCLSAILYPTDYAATMFDLSRTKFNKLNQITYFEDDLYLNPKKIIINENDNLISGYLNYIIERGKQKYSNFLSNLKEDLNYLNFNLFYKFGGFTSKDKLQIVIDSIDPISRNSGAILPQEDYNLYYNISNPIESISISGIIIQKSNGKFLIKGYNKSKPYFTIFNPIKNLASGSLSVGGVSESFVDYNGSSYDTNKKLSSNDTITANSVTSRYYKQGQIVRYNGQFYRVKVNHTPTSTFDSTLYQKLPSLPIKGGITVQKASKFQAVETVIPYGTEFNSVQEVYDFIIGYGAWLEFKGFKFDQFNTEFNKIINWNFSAQEFLYWATQNWSNGNLITLSPFANYLKFESNNSIADNIFNENYDYDILKTDGSLYEKENLNFSRDGNVCIIETKNSLDGIYFATIRTIQKEHSLVFNNLTIFNDIIYAIETGYRQLRVKLSGFKTKNWNGDYFSPGFIYDNVNINEWKQFKSYLPNDIVRFNSNYYQAKIKTSGSQTFDFSQWIKLNEKPSSKLIPNFDYKISQFEDFYSLDIDNFDYSQQKLAQHLVGYTPRKYLNNIFTNPISQYKFYQGFIKEKGTKNSINRLNKAEIFNKTTDISINEEWAFRIGNYGSYSTYNEIEFNLEEGTYLENPYIIKLVDLLPTDKNPLINYIENKNILIKPKNYITTSTFNVYPSTFDDNNIVLLTAGYIKLTDVTATAYNTNSILDIENSDNIEEGSVIWVGFLENGDWDVLRYSRQEASIVGVFVSSPAINITFVTDIAHNLKVNDIVSITKFNNQVNGIYKIVSIPNITQFTVSSDLTTIVDDDLVSPGILFKFESARYADIDSLKDDARILKLKNNEKFWVDRDLENKWKVYEKVNNYSYRTYESINLFGGQQLGSNIYSKDFSNVVLFSSPGKLTSNNSSFGSVWVLDKLENELEKKYEYSLNDLNLYYCDQNLPTEFGYSLAYDTNKEFYFVGAPASSNIRAEITTGVILSTGTGTIKTFSNEGLVKISSRKTNGNQDNTEAVIVHPDATTVVDAEYARFGHSLYINNVNKVNDTTLLVGAPGTSLHTGTGKVFAYTINTASSITILEHPSGINVESTSTIILNTGSLWGYNISGDKLGNNIAISAPGYYSTITELYGVVQIFDNSLNWKQTILPPAINTSPSNFGYSVEMSSSGKYLIVSSLLSRSNNNSLGQVQVYTLNSDELYELHQIIDNPQRDSDLQFGYKISISDDETTIAISSIGTNISNVYNFDSNLEDNTTFDQDTTKFYEKIKDSGTVNVYSKLGNYFINSNELYDADILEGSKYGLGLVANNDSIFVGAPSYQGVGISKVNVVSTVTVDVSVSLVVEFSNPNNQNGILPEVNISFINNGLTKTIDKIEVINAGDGYLYPPTAIIKDLADNIISTNLIVFLLPDNSKVYQFNKIDTSINGFKILRKQEDLVDVDKIKRIVLIDNFKEDVVEYIDVIDPLKGKISGIADREIKYKLAADPAIYSIGIIGTINDTTTNWIDEHEGELWWDLSTAKFLWYEQSDEIFRKNNWGRLFPGATIDVYEWVKSSLLPSEWAAQADTNEGLSKGISGQPKYPDNTVLSVKQVYNNVTGSFENVYYYWVKNKTLVPNIKNRNISALQVASYIADPIANGLKFASILSPSSIAFANVQPILVGNRINVNIVIDNINNSIPKHTEWILLEEGNEKSNPNTLLEKKLIDSLLGHDFLGNPVPDVSLSYRDRYGLGIRPQQTLFKNRLEALRNIIEFANSVLIKNRITGIYSFDTLLKEENIPDEINREYDQIFSNLEELDFYDTSKLERAEIECFVLNGKIRNIIINNPGYGYSLPPEIIINSDNKSAKLLTVINEIGSVVDVIIENSGVNYDVAPTLQVRPHTVIISSDSTAANKWSKNVFDYVNKSWKKIKTQSYNTPLYWNYIDWKDETFLELKTIDFVVSNLYELSNIEDVVNIGDYVKVNNSGNGFYIILERISTDKISNFIINYNLVYSENGTIQIKDSLWNFNISKYSYDTLTLDETLYDQVPDLEIQYIFEALKNDIFIKNLKVNWNLLFFTAVKYALTEQKLLDWAFKTSFISLKSNFGNLIQKPIYKIDNSDSFEEYINEIKPYRTKIRNSLLSYNNIENSNVNVSDFDLESYFNELTNKFDVVNLGNNLLNDYPWKSWYDNYKYKVGEILVADGGEGYTQRPNVDIISQSGDTGTGATAEAYLRSGKIYKIVLTNPGANYTKNPYVVISGGGSTVTKTATASATLVNDTVRKNIIGIKFDRYTLAPEINFDSAYDKFICTGNTDEYELTWSAEPYKEKIVPKLDGKLIFVNEYTILYSGGKIKKSVFKFLNFIPREGQILEVTYQKNINLYNAIDRIDYYYNPTDSMVGKDYPLLMSGYEYPNTVIQGLPFKYVTPWNPPYNPYGDFVWDDLVENYTTSELKTDVNVGDTVIILTTTTNIIPGQLIGNRNTSTSYFRPDTIVESVSPNTNSITISSPTYDLKLIKSYGTSIGSDIVVQTKKNFYGGIKTGDIAIISNVVSSGYNGTYIVSSVESNNTLILTATTILSTSTAILATSSTVRISTVLDTIYSNNYVIDSFVNTVTNVSEFSTVIYHKYSDLVKIRLYRNGSVLPAAELPFSPYYIAEIFEENANHTLITVSNLPIASVNTISAVFYARPKLEFWNIKTLYSTLDTGLNGGTWTGTNFVGALGINPEEFIIEGEKLLSQQVGYGPEELVNGHVLDSLGINVYTRSEKTSALVITGAFFGSADESSSYTLGFMPIAWAGIMVYSDGEIFERTESLNFTKTNQYYVEGNTIIIPQQSSNKRVGFTIMTTGGENVLDSNIIVAKDENEATVESLASINDVNKVYVLVNGQEIEEVTTTEEFGYMLTTSSVDNSRAAVIVYNLPAGTNTIEAWFFSSTYDYFNRVNEEYFNIGTSQSVFVLSSPPANIKPESAQAIVELGSINDSTRRRLLPPWVSYYEIINNNRTFDIDNKNQRPSGYYQASEVKVYANGIELISGFDYTVDLSNNTITLTDELLENGTAIAIMTLKDYEYIISNNILQLSVPATDSSLKVTTFSTHDDLLIKTERFKQNGINRYILTHPIFNDNYVWVYLNGIPLVHRYDFEILDDNYTVQFNEWINTQSTDTIMITYLNDSTNDNKTLAFRIFKDMFDRLEYKRITDYHSTVLTKELHVFDNEIHVENDDKLITPDPNRNKPGVIIVDGERIEFFEKGPNILKHLRRSTLGTGPANYSQVGTTVIDQSHQQSIPYKESIYTQRFRSSTTNTYVITTVTSTSTGDGIILTPNINSVDQLTVFYGGRQLRKSYLEVHDLNISYNPTPGSLSILQPEFTVNTSTQELVLNLQENIVSGIDITVIQRKGYVWTGTESLLTSEVKQAEFLRKKTASLPDIYYYGGTRELLDDSYSPLLDENNRPLEE